MQIDRIVFVYFQLNLSHDSLSVIQFCLQPERLKALQLSAGQKFASVACFENTDHRSEHPWLSPRSKDKLLPKDAAAGNKQTPLPAPQADTHVYTALLPELVLVYFHDLPLQFERLFWEQLEVSDVV